MEIRDYLSMLRRGWHVIVLLTVAGVALASAYLALAPKHFDATAVLLVGTVSSSSTTDLEAGRQYAQNVAPTFADIITSPAVLEPVAQSSASRRTLPELEELVTASARESTSLISVTASAGSASEAVGLANAVAKQATTYLPTLVPRDSQLNQSRVRVQVVQAALTPDAPVSPSPKRVLAIGLIVGLALGLATTIAYQALDTRLRRPEDLRAVSSVPILAVLPRTKRSQRHRVVLRDDPTSSAVETYRALRTTLVLAEAAERPSLLFTSIGHRDEAAVPVNLAWSMAQAGRRVLLVDLDLRRSAVGDLLSLEPSEGVADVLAGSASFGELVRPTTQPGLSVLLSGTAQPSPSDLLSSPAAERFLRQAESQYDVVVLHAPPVLVFSDAAVVARVAGATVVTVSAGRARAIDLEAASGVLQTLGVEALGLVLVGARPHVGDLRRGRPSSGPARLRAVAWDHLEVPEDGEPVPVKEQTATLASRAAHGAGASTDRRSGDAGESRRAAP